MVKLLIQQAQSVNSLCHSLLWNISSLLWYKLYIEVSAFQIGTLVLPGFAGSSSPPPGSISTSPITIGRLSSLHLRWYHLCLLHPTSTAGTSVVHFIGLPPYFHLGFHLVFICKPSCQFQGQVNISWWACSAWRWSPTKDSNF